MNVAAEYAQTTPERRAGRRRIRFADEAAEEAREEDVERAEDEPSAVRLRVEMAHTLASAMCCIDTIGGYQSCKISIRVASV
jgi:hypothetical protein